MGHFVKNKKTFNAFLDRLVNLNYEEFAESESEEPPSDYASDLPHKLTKSKNFEK